MRGWPLHSATCWKPIDRLTAWRPQLPRHRLVLVQPQEQRAKEIAEIRGDLVKAEWGQQIRNYVQVRLNNVTKGDGRFRGFAYRFAG